jgi:GDP-L-fucose synthase
VVGFAGGFRFDASKPDGPPQKLLDISRLAALGWTARTLLEEGLQHTYRWFLDHRQEARGVAGRRSAVGD